MPRSSRPLLALHAALLAVPILALPAATLAKCCSCAVESRTLCLTDAPKDSCQNLAATNPDLKDLPCKDLDDAQCKPVSETGGICNGGKTSVAGYKKGGVPAGDGTLIKFETPRLNVPIPGLQFASDIKVKDEHLTVPYLAQYISAVYKYLIGITLVTASVMIVYGGFLYMMGETMGTISKGKDVIKDSIVGLLMVFGVQTVLSAMNYEGGFDLKPLRVRFVEQAIFAWTPIPTAGISSDGGSTGESGGGGGGGGGPSNPQFTSCPFELKAPSIQYRGRSDKQKYVSGDLSEKDAQALYQKTFGAGGIHMSRDPRAQEFFEKIQPLLAGKSFEDKVATAAEAAVKCGIHLGFCGQASATLWALAGNGDPNCVKQPKNDTCNIMPGDGRFTEVPIQGAQTARYMRLRAEAGSGAEAMRLARAEFRGGPAYEKAMNELKKGDILYVYAGNTAPMGLHSITFMGWGNTNGAIAFQGEWGYNVDMNATYCIRSACGDKIWPVVKMFKPVVK